MTPSTGVTLAIVGFALVSIVCTVSGSTGPDQTARALTPSTLADLRQTAPAATPDAARPTVALVLGGGGLRGFAHLGVLRALQEADIVPDIVVGTSAGAVVGAAYASGLTVDHIESAARAIRLSSLVDLTLSPTGLIRGDNIARWIDEITSGVPIEKFPHRFAAVATDLRSGQPVAITTGSAGRAVQASAAVPGVHVPVAYSGGHLVDGGIASLVPVRFARAMGADVVIAVDVYCGDPGGDGLAVPTVLLQVMRVQSCLVSAAEKAEADILIAPAVRVTGLSAADEQEQAVRAGHETARAALSPAALAAPMAGGIRLGRPPQS